MTSFTRYPQSNLAACMLPWTEKFTFDRDIFVQQIQDVLNNGYTSIYLMGTAGEGYALTDTQFKEVVSEFAHQTAKPGLDPQVGIISLSMGQIIERISWCREQGIRMFQISLPSWGMLDEKERLLFFKTVCGSFTDCRFLHYNLPRARHILTGVEYRRLIDAVPNLVATKNSTSDYARVADLMKHAAELQHFFLESSFAFGCMLGECSLLCSKGVLFPKTTWEFFDAGRRREMQSLLRIHIFLNEVDDIIFGHCKRAMIDGSYDKVMIWLRNPRFPTRILPPYLGFSEEDLALCREAFEIRYAHIL